MSGTVDDHDPRDDLPRAAPAESRFADRYRVVKRLAGGAMGEVYEAEQVGLGRRVALKVLRRAWAGDEVSRERFRREALAAAAVRHPAVVEVYDATTDDDGAPCLVQELLEGRDLRARLQADGPLPLAESLRLLAPLCDALAMAHARGVVHRDLKPENVFLARDASGTVRPKLIDFGVARLTEHGPGLTEAGDVVGTPGYMSPEQARGAADLDARSDVWAAALLLVEMLTGRLPFRADNRNALLFEVAERDVPLDDPAIPPALRPALARALARDRALRTPDARSLLASLVEGHAWSDEPWCRALRDAHHTADLAPVALPRRVSTRSALALALGGTLALGGALALRREPAPARPPALPEALAPSARAVTLTDASVLAPVDAPSVVAADVSVDAPPAVARVVARAIARPLAVRRPAVSPPTAPAPAPAVAPPAPADPLYAPFRSPRAEHDAAP
ncbi:MAG: serine/threonine-protein kinase [Polyangiales bacterium]